MAQQERARRTRESILDAAAEEFAARGYQQARLDAVAGRTGMTKGALYGHFASKENIAEVLAHHGAQVWRALSSAWHETEDGATAAFEGLVLGLATHLHADLRLRAALRVAIESPQASRAAGEMLEDVRQLLVLSVERAQQEGGLVAHPPVLVAQLLLTVVCGVLYLPAAPGPALGTAPASGAGPGWKEIWTVLLDVLSVSRAPGQAH